MHEATLLKDIMNKLERIADEQGVAQISAVHLQLGALAHISPEHLREHFEEASRGTRAEGARVEIEEKGEIDDPHAQDILLTAIEVPD
jgi:hydrogenase nickel incorporation protein HypA/HybF